ncbi:Golgi-associated plant pathogenesis-related protein 1 [Triplophysa tibetana]|uniref:Golgi-associated plant pathogenesis-related protein 1 n=1 Tax=Triplophysa tibetana TaxID=1572043 RepID=A0A5A9NLG7_9TELE|nr:Golgi-associated plant pathogenesis-related protein 1 [Triplophysa tibetana]
MTSEMTGWPCNLTNLFICSRLTSGIKDESFRKEFLETHNEYRRKHQAPDLTLSDKLCDSAQLWADHIFSEKCMKHSATDNGENIYYAFSSEPKKLTGKEPVDSWYSEIKDYNFEQSGHQPKTDESFRKEFLETHNEYRRKHQAPDLTLSDKLCDSAQLWADHIFSEKCMKHSATDNGENIYYAFSSESKKLTGKEPVDSWYSEIKDYNFEQSGHQPKTDESFKKEFLETHNEYRRKHQAPDLTLSDKLCASAQLWADQIFSEKCMKHSATDNGENIYYAFSSEPKKLTGKEPVDSWYSEIKDYNFKQSGYQQKTGHFTQVVWKSTKEVGVGLATDGHTVFVVGEYSPPGNITNSGYYEENVRCASE